MNAKKILKTLSRIMIVVFVSIALIVFLGIMRGN
jgi:hypothetical protein